MKTKTTPRVKSIIKLSEVIEECKPCGVLYNDSKAHIMFEDDNGVNFFATIMSKGNVKFEYLEDNDFKPYAFISKYKQNKNK
jgi:hypothetical protein